MVTMSNNKTDESATMTSSSFALRFLRLQNDVVTSPRTTFYPSTFVTGEDVEVASFPQDNAANYSDFAHHFMLISRPSGRDFNLTRTFQDIEKDADYYTPFEIRDDLHRTWFTSHGV